MPRKIRILIVEDEAAIRAGLMDLFVFHGYEVDYAAEGPAGLEKALSGRFDLLLLDLMLPGMDGFEICNRIRAVDRELPIIMLTAKSADEDIVQGLSLGADDYVAKPFSVVQLVLLVQAVLRRSRVVAEMERTIQLGDGVEVPAVCDQSQGHAVVGQERADRPGDTGCEAAHCVPEVRCEASAFASRAGEVSR